MTTPTAQSFAALVATTGLFFVIWHTWHYDRFRCLLYSRHEWFRAMMCHILLFSVLCFMVWGWTNVYVAYDEYYVNLLGQTIVTPWQLWTSRNQKLTKAGLWLLCVGWGFLQAVHLEEFLYWGYLIKSISTPGGPRTSWLSSIYFRLWILGFATGSALLFGAINIETENLDMMKAYLFIVGSSISVLLACASVGLCIIFPSFVASTRRQGATLEVLGRLQFFSEMNHVRTVFRVLYSVGFLILASDAMTTKKRVNTSPFWSDTIFLVAEFAIFASSCLSVVILLPRNMTSESLPPQQDVNFHPMVEFHPHPASRQGYDPDNLSQKYFFELGDRLNIGRDAFGGMTAAASTPAFELSVTGADNRNYLAQPSTFRNRLSTDEGQIGGIGEAPFSMTADRTRRARYSEFPILPAVVQKFKSPFDVGEQRNAGPAKILVTSHTVVE